MKLLNLLVVCAFIVAFSQASLFAQFPPVPPLGETVKLQQIGTTISGSGLTDLAVPGDGSNRMFVTDKGGSVRVIQNGMLQTTPFLTSAAFPNLRNSGETGLLGFTFHPDFSKVGMPGYGKFYTFNSKAKSGAADFYNNLGTELIGPNDGNFHNVIREWTVTDPNANVFSGSSRTLMTIARVADIHNGGALAFGPDKNLYVSFGDGGYSYDGKFSNTRTDGHTDGIGNAQDLGVIYGKIIRINPILNQPNTALSSNGNYSIPTSNPFVGAPGLDEIYAYGMRNPHRISFDSLNGELFIGDPGNDSYDEINRVISGGNHQWPNVEGNRVRDTTPISGPEVPPFAVYLSGPFQSLIGGHINRSELMPASLYGKYVFGEFDNGLRYVDPQDPTGQIYRMGIDPNGAAPIGLVFGMGRDESNNLYVLTGSGQVLRIVPEPSAWLICTTLASLLFIFKRRRKVAVTLRSL